MDNFEYKTLCILGRQPSLGLAELESLYGAQHLKPLTGGALLDIEAGSINFKRLGGTVRVAKVLNVLPTTKWPDLTKYLTEKVPEHLQYLPEGKFTLGVSVYGVDARPAEIQKSLLELKKIIKKTGRPVRIVPNQTPELNTAQVLHNRLTHRGAWELLFFRDGDRTILAQTLFVQDIEAYAARDQARPKRDAKVGMLPPKLAQIIINLANPPAGSTILDPFCGTGVVLQEAVLDGFGATGTDLQPRMVEYSQENIDWLKTKYPALDGQDILIEIGDATKHKWSQKFDAVASEIFLGQPLSQFPDKNQLHGRVQEVNEVLEAFLKNLRGQIDNQTDLCLALPAWRDRSGKFTHLPALDNLTSLGYNRKKFVHVKDSDLVYFRENQLVARELVVFKRI